ncbi:glycosyltransferase family 4 protein [Pedobacter sandarakinus]|uniref:glycosyltransferase family 4 protein n=1 Tax=Pedobacter sandarakinus TaxID=353156 RepID=UPI002246F6C2|nr:glycosyltransferase family 4 protein [Pedobacter sandarakinus]MCX2575937.1 glycosyltransferase family 4 protein [Pedobacter sandarakinus]
MLLLTLKMFSETGGIEKVNRVLSKTLHEYVLTRDKQPLQVLSLCDQPGDLDTRYCKKENFRGYGKNKVLFTLSALYKAFSAQTILLSHINLVSIAASIIFFGKRKRIIMLAHGIEVWRPLKPWKKSFLKKYVEIWAVSRYTAAVLAEKHGISTDKIVVLNNCLDPYFTIPDKFARPSYLASRHQIESDQPVLLTVSRLSSYEMYKGYDVVIECVKSLITDFPNIRYLLAGKADLNERNRLTNLIEANGLMENVILLDYIPDHELADYFLLADLFVMPSKKEGFGIVFIEAAACGCTALAGNQDGSKDALLDGDLGLLVNPDDKEAIRASIHKFLKSGQTIERIKALQRSCLEHFGYELYKNRVSYLLDSSV